MPFTFAPWKISAQRKGSAPREPVKPFALQNTLCDRYRLLESSSLSTSHTGTTTIAPVMRMRPT